MVRCDTKLAGRARVPDFSLEKYVPLTKIPWVVRGNLMTSVLDIV